MRIFVLCTGRCGSTTFAKACSHITNYTSAHESGRYIDWSYPEQHIEIDNRLSWFLGSLIEHYPGEKLIHLCRDRDEVIDSFTRRQHFGSPVMRAYRLGICQRSFSSDREAAAHYVDTVLNNIALVRVDLTIRIANPERSFRQFWIDIGAEGNIEAALLEFGKHYNEGV
jgi:hypothetical protein